MTAFLHSQILIFIPVRKTYMNIYLSLIHI